MTIDLNTFKIVEGRSTNNWGLLNLCATSADNGRNVFVASIDYATGAIDEYPNASKSNQLEQIQKFKQYLIDNNINDYIGWANNATAKAKGTFVTCFNQNNPNFSVM